jgi:hypothetical protein
MNIEQRVQRLEHVFQPGPAEKPDWVKSIEATADVDPAAFATWRVCFARAQRRHLAETRQPPRWDQAERDAHVDAEWDRLTAMGQDAWLAEGDDLSVLPGWPSTTADEVAFFREKLRRMTQDAASCHAHLVRLGFRS